MIKHPSRQLSASFHYALAMVEQASDSETVFLPAEPTRPMVAIGARAGHVSPAIARRIYQAMARAGSA